MFLEVRELYPDGRASENTTTYVIPVIGQTETLFYTEQVPNPQHCRLHTGHPETQDRRLAEGHGPAGRRRAILLHADVRIHEDARENAGAAHAECTLF